MKRRVPYTKRRRNPVGVYAKKRTAAPQTSSVSRFQGPYRPVAEKKSIDVDSTAVIDSTGAVVLLNGCAPGTGIGNRVSRKTQLRSLLVRASALGTSGTGTAQDGRMLLIYDKQTNAAAPAVADVLAAADPRAPMELSGRDRFVILADWYYAVADRTAPGDTMAVQFNRYTKMNLPCVFNDEGNGTVGDIITGAIFLVSLGDNAAGNTAGVLTFYSRVRFEDS